MTSSPLVPERPGLATGCVAALIVYGLLLAGLWQIVEVLLWIVGVK